MKALFLYDSVMFCNVYNVTKSNTIISTRRKKLWQPQST